MSASALVLHAVERISPPDAGVVPVDPPRAHASGPAPYRLLVVGAPSVASRGVTTHDLGLIGVLARRVAGLTGHGVDVDGVLAGSGDARSLAWALRSRDLARVDGVVLVVDADVLGRGSEAVRHLHRLLVQLWGRIMPASSIVVAVTPGSDEQRRAIPDGLLDELSGGTAALTRVVRLDGASAALPARERYADWGAAIAAVVADGLVEPVVWSDPVDEVDERRRVAAMRRLGPFDEDWEDALRRLVKDAARAYGAQSAAVTLLDGPRARYLAGTAVAERSVPRDETICDTALRTYGGVLVGDAQADDRFRDLPLVATGAVRFYAGYRIDSPEGVPLAVLCVFDPEPRRVRGQDIALLRDFALIAERRIREHRSWVAS